MIRRPSFISFAGIDNSTDLDDVAKLQTLNYNIEWAVLFSYKLQGQDPRYPSLDFIKRLTEIPGLNLAAHLCGKYARGIDPSDSNHELTMSLDLSAFNRVQINHGSPNIKEAGEFGVKIGKRCILQTKEFTSTNTNVDWLLDASGGKGIEPEIWPKYPGHFVGYA